MTGPEHYRMAEQGLPLIHRETDGAWAIARAVESLVHATLALAAATALNTGTDGMFGDDLAAWERVAAENVSDVDPETGRDYAEEDDIRRQLAAEQEAEVAEEIQKLHGLEAAHSIARSVRRGWAQHDAEDGAL